MTTAEVDRARELVPHLLDIPHKKVWVDYDEEADVLYVNFKTPSHADDSELTDDDVIIRYEKGSMVGMTFLHAKKESCSQDPVAWTAKVHDYINRHSVSRLFE